MNEQMNVTRAEGGNPEDEIDLAQAFMILWSKKRWIVACTFVAALIGIVYGFLTPSVYHAEAIIVLKERGQSGGLPQLLSQFGGTGGAAATPFALGSSSVGKIEIILKGHELAEAVINTNNLMPVLFHDLWDSVLGTWKSKNPRKIPTIRMGVRRLQGGMLAVETDDKKGLITVGANAGSPVLAKQLVEFYLVELNNKIRRDVLSDADSNRKYLETQLSYTFDPTLAEKIQNMMAAEIERSMLMSSQAFQIMEGPVVPEARTKPQRKKIIMLACLIGLLASVGGVFARSGFIALKMIVTGGESSSNKDSKLYHQNR